ncbi:AAA family ATPase, partial [Treponema sp. UBA753]|uniref:AAA family ATPase n=1 Tax=Treponema sp. UBA753 TaxID=1947747 RepID=UPI0025EA751E
MADPICRWRNATPETVCEIVEELPKSEMPEDEFRDSMAKSKFGSEFFRTPYQFACQLALYFIDDDKIYHPRFRNNISIEEADKYLHHWFSLYYVPNPYTKKGFKEIERPLFFEQTLMEKLKLKSESSNFQDLLKQTFKDEIGEIDILRNLINKYSTFLKVENDIISLTEKGKSKMEINVDRDDKKSFFKSFDEKTDSSASPYTNPRQIIFYGVPGCGKSHKIGEMLKNPDKFKIESEEHQVIRTVFHPDYTNSDFIGQILPKVNADKTIEYVFVPGPFTKILAKAIKHSSNQYVLIIEEINRGNAASIFGETFQLLDRMKKGQTITEKIFDGDLNTYGQGWSEYFFMNDDINHYILKECNGNDTNKAVNVNGIVFSENTGIRLPPNLSILATMNTSDQNVFTLDNAFQRRWKM